MATRRLINLQFDDFGRSQLRAAAQRYGLTNEELLGHAAHGCLSRRASHGLSRWVPRFRRVLRGGRFRGQELSVTLELADEEWGGLEAEAERQGVSVARLIEHSAVHLLADIESGRVSKDELDRARHGTRIEFD